NKTDSTPPQHRGTPVAPVGCGLCQTRCHGINVAAKGLLEESAIIIEAGNDHEDRLLSGSYIELRRKEAGHQELSDESPADYLPQFLDNE
ncbi:MAG: hypothetical protein ACKVHE_28260, partial [Planctomycetales bacterium]